MSKHMTADFFANLAGWPTIAMVAAVVVFLERTLTSWRSSGRIFRTGSIKGEGRRSRQLEP
jgi:hypothetical protein